MQRMLSILKKFGHHLDIIWTSNQGGLPKTFPLGDILLSSKKLPKLWYRVSPQSPIPPNDVFFKEQ